MDTASDIDSLGATRRATARLLPLLLCVVGLATTTLPLLAFRYPPTQDGPAHENSAMVLAALETGQSTLFDQVDAKRPTPPSNQLASRIMAWAGEWGAGAGAETIVWLLIFVAAVGVIVGNLWVLGPDKTVFALLLFPTFAGVLVNLGFTNYLIGLVLFIQSAFVLQAGMRQPSPGWAVLLGILAGATYLAHPITGIALAVTVASFGASYLLRWWWSRVGGRVGAGEGADSMRTHRALVPLGCILAGLVVSVLAAYEAFPQIVRLVDIVATGKPPSGFAIAQGAAGRPQDRVATLAGLDLVSYQPADFLFAAAFAALLAWLAWRRFGDRRRWREARIEDDWLAPIGVLSALAALVPQQFEYFLPIRLLACLVPLVVIWLASTRLGRGAWQTLLVLGLLFNGAWLAWRLHWSAKIETILTEYASIAPALPEHGTLLEVRSPASHLQYTCIAPRPRALPCGFKPTLHFASAVVGQRDLVVLSNYQLRREAGFFPIDLRAPWDQYLPFEPALEIWPPDGSAASLADFVALLRRTPPDIIVAWDERLATGATPGLFPAALQPLLPGYALVFRSRPLGAAYVYQRVPGKP